MSTFNLKSTVLHTPEWWYFSHLLHGTTKIIKWEVHFVSPTKVGLHIFKTNEKEATQFLISSTVEVIIDIFSQTENIGGLGTIVAVLGILIT